MAKHTTTKHEQYGHVCDTCRPHRSANSLLTGPALGRRDFFKLTGAGVSGFFLTPLLSGEATVQAAAPSLIGRAKNCIFILLTGAPSHIDTFDLKPASWTPADFNPTQYNGIWFPQGLMPNLAAKLDKLAIVRSLRAPALVHPLQQSWAQIARSPSSRLGKIAPNMGSVVALEMEKNRKSTQKLPGFVSLNTGGSVVGPGYFNGLYAPFDVTAAPTGFNILSNTDGQANFERRYATLQSLDSRLRNNSPLGDDVTTMGSFYGFGKGMMYDPVVDAAFKFTTEEQTRYGNTGLGNSCLVARNILKSDQGTRYIQINYGSWDHHDNIYDRAAPDSLYPVSTGLDLGLSNLLTDLAASPGASGGTLLDETLIVAMGEFGRTPGAPTNQGGRDHYFQHFAVFAGGGVSGGKVIGETDFSGTTVANPGWSQNRPIQYEDIAATIYSALGIDYTTKRNDDPFNSGFEYVPFASEGAWYPINELFGRENRNREAAPPRGRSTGRSVAP
ncbi:MAG: DUF1501 domain-containing protein [Blastocatellia bacterium]